MKIPNSFLNVFEKCLFNNTLEMELVNTSSWVVSNSGSGKWSSLEMRGKCMCVSLPVLGISWPPCAHLCMWRLEASIICLSRLVLTFFWRQRLLNLELTQWLSRLASKALGCVHWTSCVPLPRHTLTLAVYVSSGDLTASFHACTAIILPIDSSPPPAVFSL